MRLRVGASRRRLPPLVANTLEAAAGSWRRRLSCSSAGGSGDEVDAAGVGDVEEEDGEQAMGRDSCCVVLDWKRNTKRSCGRTRRGTEKSRGRGRVADGKGREATRRAVQMGTYGQVSL